MAVDAKTGKYRWHAKQVPHDGWNYEAAVGLMVADVPVDGKARHVVVSVPKQGFAYQYDAATGKYLAGTKYVDVAWAKGLDANGRPIFNPDAMYWNRPGEETLVLPGGMGAHGWETLAYNPKANVLYVPTMVMPVSRTAEGAYDWYYGERPDAEVKPRGEVVAIDVTSNSVKWRTTTSNLPVNGGLLHTAGGIVFQGLADGRLLAFDEATGKVLWSRQTGGASVPRLRRSCGTASSISSWRPATARRQPPPPWSAATVPRPRAARLRACSLQARRDGLLSVAGRAGADPPAARPAAGSNVGQARRRGLRSLRVRILPRQRWRRLGGRRRAQPHRTQLDLAAFKQVVQGGERRFGGMPQFKGVTDAEAAAPYAYIIDSGWNAHEGKATRSTSLGAH